MMPPSWSGKIYTDNDDTLEDVIRIEGLGVCIGSLRTQHISRLRQAVSMSGECALSVSMQLKPLYTAFIAATLAFATPNAECANTTFDPDKGHLVIVGGNLQSESVWKKIVELAEGPDASIVVIPTAGGEPSYNESFASAVTLRSLGANNGRPQLARWRVTLIIVQ